MIIKAKVIKMGKKEWIRIVHTLVQLTKSSLMISTQMIRM